VYYAPQVKTSDSVTRAARPDRGHQALARVSFLVRYPSNNWGRVKKMSRSWMMFVDGENLTARAERFASEAGLTLTEGTRYQRETFIWMPNIKPTICIDQNRMNTVLAWSGIRAYYYTSMKADDPAIQETRHKLWTIGFTPYVFKKVRKEDKAKGVDIALTKDMLTHAANQHYEVACLVAGDGDYVPLVEEVKRMGRIVVCMFFSGSSSGLSQDLKLACDDFYDLNRVFDVAWRTGAP
jgi:uncharacterized LabA/DUF88 family protein